MTSPKLLSAVVDIECGPSLCGQLHVRLDPAQSQEETRLYLFPRRLGRFASKDGKRRTKGFESLLPGGVLCFQSVSQLAFEEFVGCAASYIDVASPCSRHRLMSYSLPRSISLSNLVQADIHGLETRHCAAQCPVQAEKECEPSTHSVVAAYRLGRRQ